mgnify:CR=1 FL=1
MLKIAVVGLGYVGLSNAVLLAQNSEVHGTDIDPTRVSMINERKSPVCDFELETFLAEHELNLQASSEPESVYANAEYVIVATPIRCTLCIFKLIHKMTIGFFGKTNGGFMNFCWIIN